MTAHVILADLDKAHHLEVVFSVEGRPAAEHSVEDDAARPGIALLIIVFRDNLGRHVVRCALPLTNLAVLWHGDRQPEVNELEGIVVTVEQEVLRLEVAVHVALAVDVVRH